MLPRTQVFMDYRFNPNMPHPDWYSPVDPEATAKMWAVNKQDSTAQTLLNNSWYAAPGGKRFVFSLILIYRGTHQRSEGGRCERSLPTRSIGRCDRTCSMCAWIKSYFAWTR